MRILPGVGGGRLSGSAAAMPRRSNCCSTRSLGRMFCRPSLGQTSAAHLAAFVTLCQGLSQMEVEGLVEEEARTLGCSAGAGPLAGYEALASALPGERGSVAPILPDVVGEAVVLEALGGGAAEKALMAVSRAARQFGERVSASLIHLAQDYGSDRPEPIAWFERLVDLRSLSTLVDQLPHNTLALRSAYGAGYGALPGAGSW
jgi:hypothetical protein